MVDKIFLSPKEAAELLGVSIATIYKWVHFKEIPYRKHGRLLKFDRRSLIDWSNSQIQQEFTKET
jgi:excisionase family DNA binding protein